MTHKQPEEGDGDRWDAKWLNQRISRRKLLASVGATGAVLAVAGFLGGRLHSLGARTAQSDITALNNSACVEVNVKHFGAVGDGVTDDTVSVQQSLDSLPQGGGTVLFPVGTYLITRSLSVKTDNVTIIGSGRASKLIYTYEQTSGDNSFTASLLAFKSGIRGVTVKDLHLQYTGPYYPNFGDSYKGKVSGLRFMQCSDVRIEHVEISGFNSCAIDVATGYASRYANRFKVHQCYLHHNRVSGVRYGYVENISITDCDLDYHGSELDGGTGYGCCGYSEEVPLNVQIIGNRASYNYRKGIDLHAGKQSIIEGNLCHGNRLYGIYAEGVNAGNTLIRGNIISGMDRKTIGIPEPYTWITGIDFGCASSALTEEQYHHFVVEGNQIIEFGLGEGNAYPIHSWFDFRKGIIQIRNNVIRASRITNLILLSSSLTGPRNIQIDISGNQALIEKSVDYAIEAPFCTQMNVSGNQINIGQSEMDDGVIAVSKDSLQSFTYIGNHITCALVAASSALKGYDKEDWLKAKTVHIGNFLNGHQEQQHTL